MKKTALLFITRIKGDKRENLPDPVIAETPIHLFLNHNQIATIVCTPEHIPELAVGYLFTEQTVKDKKDIIKLEYDSAKGTVYIETKNREDSKLNYTHFRFITPGHISPDSSSNENESSMKKIESTMNLTVKEILEVCAKAEKKSELFKQTGGVHSAALCSRNRVLYFAEDIGRHNALDKIIGMCVMKNISMNDKIIITSGRVSSVVMRKVINASVPVLISRSAPTAEAVGLAKNFGITLIGFARRIRFNIYSHESRITE